MERYGVARRTVVETYDDIDETPIGSGGETISFAVDGVEYTIDLSEKNATEFRRKIDYYIGHAARVGGRKRRGAPTRGITSDQPSVKDIRAWAEQAGLEVSARGRLPQKLLDD